jgi:hypothetical protein
MEHSFILTSAFGILALRRLSGNILLLIGGKFKNQSENASMHRRFKGSRSLGLTLIEILISLFVLAVIFMGTIKALQLTARIQGKSEDIAQASQVFSDVSEKILNMRDTAFPLIVTGLTFNTSNVPSLSQLENPSVTITVAPYKDRFGIDITAIKQVTIRLNWTSILDGVLMSDSFTTLVSEPPIS